MTEEKILIPPNKEGTIKIPEISNNDVFLKGNDGENLGIAIPPSGLKLLNEIEKNNEFQNIDLVNIEEKLQIFVNMNLLRSIRFRKMPTGWNLEIESPQLCNNGQKLNVQYPCPICSAVITAITRALNQKIRIYSVTTEDEKIIYHLNILKKKNKMGN